MTGFVYVVGWPGSPAVKIGTTAGAWPDSRLCSLQLHSPLGMIVWFVAEVRGDIASNVETAAHAKVAEHRIYGEFFSITYEDAICALIGAADEAKAKLFPRLYLIIPRPHMRKFSKEGKRTLRPASKITAYDYTPQEFGRQPL